MAFKWFTNAHTEHYGKPIAVNGDHVLAIFEVEREREGAQETVTILFGGPQGSWEVQEDSAEAVSRLNSQ
jgi:hypothetical protein